MNAKCPKCFFIVTLDAGRYPPWCKKCGVDLKPSDYLPVAAQPVELPTDPLLQYVSWEPVLSTVTSSGPKNWLRGGDVVKPAAPAQPAAPVKRTPVVAKPGAAIVMPKPAAERPAPKPKPAPAATPEVVIPIGTLHIVGVVLLLIGGVMAGGVWKSNKNFGEATGEVKLTDVKSGGAIAHTRRIQYVVNGVTYDCDPKSYNLDETVSLLYDVNDPLKVQVGSKVSRYGWAVMVAVVGLALLGAGILQTNREQRERERASPKPDL